MSAQVWKPTIIWILLHHSFVLTWHVTTDFSLLISSQILIECANRLCFAFRTLLPLASLHRLLLVFRTANSLASSGHSKTREKHNVDTKSKVSFLLPKTSKATVLVCAGKVRPEARELGSKLQQRNICLVPRLISSGELKSVGTQALF